MHTYVERAAHGPWWRRPFFRRRSLIVEGFQTRLIAMQALLLAVMLICLAAALFAPSIGALVAIGDRPRLADGSRFLVMRESVWPAVAVFFLGSTLLSMLMMHRVAGPIYRFRQVFADVSRGVLTMRVSTRTGDYLTEEAAELDEMVSTLRTRIEAAKVAVAKAEGQIADLMDRKGGESQELQDAAAMLATASRTLNEFHTERKPPAA
jgi:methyl-accepting chemotaxis protein